MSGYDPRLVTEAVSTARFSAVARTGLVAGAIGTWDPRLLRGPRVLVPVDVQAYVVPRDGSGEACVRIPGPLAPGAPPDASALAGPPPFDVGAPREPGVHLHWAMPDALLRGSITKPGGDLPAGTLALPALPDRWAVLRLLAPDGGETVRVDGWVLVATSAQVVPLAAWTGTPPEPDLPEPQRLAPDGLTGAAGGSLAWTACYDAALGRFALHDPLADLAADPTLGGALPGGPHVGLATYLVLGWWSTPPLDPLDDVRTEGGLVEALARLGWVLPPTRSAPPEPKRSANALLDLGLVSRLRDDVQLRADAPADVAGLAGQDDAPLVRASHLLAPRASTLLHGAVVSVPVDGGLPDGPQLRPAAEQVGLVVGRTTTETVAVLGAPALGGDGTDGGAQAAAERLLAGFAAGLLRRLGSPDGIVDLDERRHALGFAARADAVGTGVADRVRSRGAAVPPRPPRPRSAGRFSVADVVLDFAVERQVGLRLREETRDATSVKALDKGIAAAASSYAESRHVLQEFSRRVVGAAGDQRQASVAAAAAPAPPGASPDDPDPGRVVERPAPPRHQPIDPTVVISGARRSLRFGGDGRHDAAGALRVRHPEDVAQDYAGVLPGAAVVPVLASGALPEEALALAREATLLSPDWVRWLAGRAAARQGLDERATGSRLAAELALRYDRTGAYTQAVSLTALGGDPRRRREAADVGVLGRAGGRGTAAGWAELGDEALRTFSVLAGVEPSPVAVTAWAQPWVPLWIEWEVLVQTTDPNDPGDPLAGWALGAVDLESDDASAAEARTSHTVTATGRAPLSPSPAVGLREAVVGWLREEDERDDRGVGELGEDDEARLGALARHVDSLDLVAATLDGVLDALRGLPTPVLRARGPDRALIPPTPAATEAAAPYLLAAGRLRLTRCRLVDAFGRTLELDVEAAKVPAADAAPRQPGEGAVLAQRPRFTRPARVRLDLVDSAADDVAAAAPARVDEIDPGQQVSPVAGFLLPDHVDESVELFGPDAAPVGELLTSPIGGAVGWEPAPGRPLPPDAAPGAGLLPAQRALGRLAAGILAADAQARAAHEAAVRAAADTGAELPEPPESALAAFLRAVDTTLWTVDPLAGAGSSAPASIVGRPVAVVRAALVLDVLDDLDELTLDDAARAARAAAFARLARVAVPVRIGEITRTDDGVLGFFLDDDYTRFRLVDRTVAERAKASGRRRGLLGPYGTAFQAVADAPIRHPYVVPDGTVALRPGVPRALTLLLLPGAAAHITSGVVPRTSIRLQKAWYGAGLDALSPSVRAGPVLLDPGEVRLPRVAALDERQVWTRREGPLGWRDDAILAATQAALLPDAPATLQEGWIRVLPPTPDDGTRQ